MASKFQNRLVGTIIIVALGVIVLPGLLDGKKKHYQDDFASIPLVPKPGDADEADASPQASQSLPSQPPEGAGAAVEQADKVAADDAAATSQGADAAIQSTAPPVKETPPAARREPAKAAPAPRQEQAKPVPAKPAPAVKPVAKPAPKPVLPPTTAPVTAPEEPAAIKPEAPAKTAAAPKPAAAAPEAPPAGQAWVVQLGALKNAAKVTEIVGKLRLSGYRVYTLPAEPVAGQITRIFVGPDASRQKLESALPEMNQLSGLSGQLRSYKAR
ncbi:cell division protein DedD [Sodalis sp. RH21]|uniref:cell division protein DedD n=1 Tax=unclassified Sodalis (in: enterobacteria) TaxID=2636512 RepID=UPI0039B3BD8F